MEKRPLIGITGSYNETGRYLLIRMNYMQSVLDAGGLPVLLPEITSEEMADEILNRLDGLMLAGGVDVEPSRYGEEKLPECEEVDLLRDQFELLMIPRAIERHIPVFGICRGIQVLTVALGGTLFQDIESQLGIPKVKHQQEPPYSAATHMVNLRPGSMMEQIIGSKQVHVNSMHHQAIKNAGTKLSVDGYSDDGVIEAVSGINNDRVFGVQFHPEYLADHDEASAKLFKHFVQLAKDYQAEKE